MSIINFNVGLVPNDGLGNTIRFFAQGTNLNNQFFESTKANLIDGRLSEDELPASSTSFMIVPTYEDLLNIASAANLIIVRVETDENKGINNSIYYLYPDGIRMWIAANKDN